MNKKTGRRWNDVTMKEIVSYNVIVYASEYERKCLHIDIVHIRVSFPSQFRLFRQFVCEFEKPSEEENYNYCFVEFFVHWL